MNIVENNKLGIWFPTIRTNTGTDVFTERLVKGLNNQGVRAEITWLPLHAEYAPWTVAVPSPPVWATVAHVNTWIHKRFLPKNIPAVATVHHSMHHPDVLRHKGWLRAAYHRYWIAPTEREIMQQVKAIVGVSQFVALTAQETLLEVPIKVIYNGIDTEIYRPDLAIKKPNKPFRLIFVGSWKVLKGVEFLAPIMSELGDGFELYYTGGAAAEKYKKGMPSNMHDLGRLSDDGEVIKAMQAADALLLPSRSEGHPLVAIEAMACGVPVVSTEGSSLVEVVKNDKTGFLCMKDDVSSFVAAIRKLQLNADRYSSMAEESRALAKKLFSEDKMLADYLEVYRTVL